jgi:hypothetical protein
VDGVEEMIAEGYGKGTPRFSADGGRVAYTALVEGRWFLVLDGEILAPIIGENSERAFVAAIDEAFWSPDLHRLRPGMAFLVAHPYVTFKAVDGRGANEAVLELPPGPHTVTLDYVHPITGSAFDVELPVEIPGPGIHVLTAESRKFGLWKQMVENLGDLDLFLPTTKVGTVSFDTMNIDHLAQNYMTMLAMSERKESQVLGLVRQRRRPAAVRSVAAGVAADMLAKGELDSTRAISLLAAVVADTTEDRELRRTIREKLVELGLAGAAGDSL